MGQLPTGRLQGFSDLGFLARWLARSSLVAPPSSLALAGAVAPVGPLSSQLPSGLAGELGLHATLVASREALFKPWKS